MGTALLPAVGESHADGELDSRGRCHIRQNRDVDGRGLPASAPPVLVADAAQGTRERERDVERDAVEYLVAPPEGDAHGAVPEVVVRELVRVEPLAVPGGSDLCERVHVEPARLENPESLAPVVVDGEEVVEFRHGGLGACTRVALGAAQVGVAFQHHRAVVVRIERVLFRVGAPVEYAGDFSACGEACAGERALQAPVEVDAELVDVEVPVLGLDGAAFGDVETFGECTRTVEVAVRVLVVDCEAVALAADSRAVFAFPVTEDSEEGHRAEALLVCPRERILVQVEVRPVVTERELQRIVGLEQAVACGSRDCLHGDCVVA